jgi:tetratricopeptide (TPR) repeat protein
LGDDAQADREFTRADELITSTGMREPADHRFHGDHIEAVVALGNIDRSQALLNRLEERGRILPRPWTLAVAARCRGLLQAARGDLEAAQGSLEEALGRHDRLDMPFELARTLLCLGRMQRRLNRRKAARETLARALEIFESLGTPLWAERANSELSRVGVRRAPGALTESELRVAELAATGTRTRRSPRVFVSRRTVEANLARACRSSESARGRARRQDGAASRDGPPPDVAPVSLKPSPGKRGKPRKPALAFGSSKTRSRARSGPSRAPPAPETARHFQPAP